MRVLANLLLEDLSVYSAECALAATYSYWYIAASSLFHQSKMYLINRRFNSYSAIIISVQNIKKLESQLKYYYTGKKGRKFEKIQVEKAGNRIGID